MDLVAFSKKICDFYILNYYEGEKMKEIAFRTLFVLSVCVNVLLIELALENQLLTENVSENTKFIVVMAGNIALSIIASMLYTFYCKKSDEEKEKRQFVLIKNDIQDALLITRKFSPTHIYPESDVPIPEYNKKINDSIERTEKFYYFSDRAMFVAKRLKRDIKKHHDRFTVYICIQDIRDESALNAREEEFRKRELQRKGTRKLDEIVLDEKIDVLKSLYVLSRLEGIDLKIYLHREISYMRFEITDDLVALSFLPMQIGGKRFPPTLIYENEDLFRRTYLDYINDVMFRYNPIDVSQIDINWLRKLAKDAGIKNISNETITSYYDDL